MMNFTDFATKVTEDARLSDLIARYDENTDSLTDEELTEMVNRFDRIESWDNLEMGFDPYMGCYSDDC